MESTTDWSPASQQGELPPDVVMTLLDIEARAPYQWPQRSEVNRERAAALGGLLQVQLGASVSKAAVEAASQAAAVIGRAEVRRRMRRSIPGMVVLGQSPRPQVQCLPAPTARQSRGAGGV